MTWVIAAIFMSASASNECQKHFALASGIDRGVVEKQHPLPGLRSLCFLRLVMRRDRASVALGDRSAPSSSALSWISDSCGLTLLS